jgi:hypothetical protein
MKRNSASEAFMTSSTSRCGGCLPTTATLRKLADSTSAA